jgi:hypothetical protein
MTRRELEEAHAALTLALDALDEIGRLRAEVSMAHRRIVMLLREQDADTTPVRPPSVSAMQAYQRSADFGTAGTPPKKGR